MQAILSVTIPFFALVLCGYLAARRHVLPESAIPGLNAFVLYFSLPCLLFRFGASTPVFELLNPVVLGVYLAAGLLIVFFTVAVSLNARVGMQDAAFGALVAAFPNTGFMGVPLLVALLGKSAAGPVICSVLADLFITSSLCIALAQAAVRVMARPPVSGQRRCAPCVAPCPTPCPGRSPWAPCSRWPDWLCRGR
jgi:predicted permease